MTWTGKEVNWFKETTSVQYNKCEATDGRFLTAPFGERVVFGSRVLVGVLVAVLYTAAATSLRTCSAPDKNPVAEASHQSSSSSNISKRQQLQYCTAVVTCA